MRRLLTTSLFLAVTACGASGGDSGPSAGDPGTYTRMLGDGTRVETVIRTDGSYSSFRGKALTEGSVTTEDNRTCFTGLVEGAQETCWTNGAIRPGGTFESTGADGEKVIITYSPDLPAPMLAGLYKAGDGTTTYGQTRLNADGTYIDLDGDTEVGSGSWREHGHQVCFDPEGPDEGAKERCWVNGPAGEDGSFTSTRDDGSQSYQVTPINE